MSRICWFAWIVVLTHVSLAQAVYVVGPTAGPGIQFVGIQAGIDAATNGDVLLVQSGSYAGFTLSGKGLTIVGAGVGATVVSGHITVTNTPSSGPVFINGFTVTAGFECLGPGRLTITDAAMPFGATTPTSGVRIVDAEAGIHRCSVGPIVIENSPHTTISHCTVSGSSGAIVPAGTAGVAATNSRVTIDSSSITGAHTFIGPGNPAVVTQSFPGVVLVNSPVRVFGSGIVQGGHGFGVSPFFIVPPSAGLVTDGVATVHGTSLQGGTGHGGYTAPGYTGTVISAALLPEIVNPGPWITSAVHFVTVSLLVSTPATTFAIAVSPAAAFQTAPSPFLGEVLIDTSAIAAMGSANMSAAGSSIIGFPPLPLPPSWFYVPFYFQVATYDATSGTYALGGTSAFVLQP